MSASSVLQLRGVTKRFGGLVANSDISFDVERGSILGLIGPNGAGKSTLFNLIAGLYKPSEGSILFKDVDITGLPAPERCRLGVARTFQVPRSFNSITVLENVVVGAFVRHGSSSAARRAAQQTLDYVELGHRAQAQASRLTPPEKRRLEVARALVTHPELILLDESMTGLTPAEAQSGVALIRKVQAQGVTVVMVEHVMEIVMPLVDRAVVLDLGKVLVDGPPSEVVKDERVIMAYLGERRA